jgi:hypothetical protein
MRPSSPGAPVHGSPAQDPLLQGSPWQSAAGAEVPKRPSWMQPARVEVHSTSWAGAAQAPVSAAAPQPSHEPEPSDDASGADFVGAGEPMAPDEPPPPDPFEVLGPIVEEVRAGLAAARTSLEEARRDALRTSERQLVELAIAIAERVVGREVARDRTHVAAWAREGLEALAADDAVKVVVSSRVARALKSLEDAFGPGVSPEIVVDDRLNDTQCEVRGRWGRVDAGVRARLDAVVAALGLPDEERLDDDEAASQGSQ